MKFSIVMPTRNRAEKLQHALRSALTQTFDDYEVIVSNNDSHDETAAVVAAASDRRVRYFKTDRGLSMVDHWEFALAKAEGDWVLFLCDDDALLPQALEYLDLVSRRRPRLELMQYGFAAYVYDDGSEVGRGNYLDIGKIIPTCFRTIDSASRLAENFRRLSGTMPKFLNSAVKLDLIERIKCRTGRMFLDWAPDYSAGTLLLASTPSYVELGPLMVWGENMQSYGSGALRDPARMREFYSQFDSFSGRLEFSPYPELLTISNTIYDTLCRARAALGQDSPNLTISETTFRRLLLADLRRYVERGHDEYRATSRLVRRDLAKIRLRNLVDPRAGRDAVRQGLQSFGRRLKRNAPGQAMRCGKRLRPVFDDIYAASRFAGELVVLPDPVYLP